MSLNDWLNKGWLVKHRSSRREINDLLAIADRDLADAQVASISTDMRLSVAHNAALQLSIAVLIASGYRPSRDAYHYRAIQSLEFTIGASKDLIDQLDAFRMKRNISDYERSGAISDQEADEMFQLAVELRETVTTWLKKNYPKLV
jgi:hypothetical protein